MNNFLIRFLRLNLGLAIASVGVVTTINAQIGYTPWDVLHVGLADTIGLTLGITSILVGLCIGLLSLVLGEKLGLGTWLNMTLIGLYIDLIRAKELIPLADSFPIGLVMMLAGLWITSFGVYFYISSGFGAGPRDSLMVAVTRFTRWPVGTCRIAIESTAAIVGWFLGGMLGLGTLVGALGIGFFIQVTFWIMRFDPTSVRHETLTETVAGLMGRRVTQS